MSLFDYFKKKTLTNAEIDTLSCNSPAKVETFIFDMRVQSNTILAPVNYGILNSNELTFFDYFRSALITAKLDPSKITLSRLSSGCFNVEYGDICVVGKIDLYEISNPISYAVIKKGNKRATKIYTSLEEAQHFIDANQNYEIQERIIHHETYMHYFIGSSGFKELRNPSLQECIDAIPRWIKYIKYCQHQP